MLNLPQSVHIAIHAMALLSGQRNEVLSAERIAGVLGISADHLAKVLQRLSKVRLVRSMRGPNGGYALNTDPATTPLLSIYEAMEGKLVIEECVFNSGSCGGGKCVFGSMLKDVNRVVSDYLGDTMLADVAMAK